MSKTAIINLETLVSGDLATGELDADSVIFENGKSVSLGFGLNVSNVDVVVDAHGTTVIPGLID